MKTNVNFSAENVKNVRNNHKQAKEAVSGLGVMYYVNQLNKLARKNEYLNAEDVRAFGKDVKAYCEAMGITVKENCWFDARVFVLVDGVSCYKIVKHVTPKSGYFAIEEDIVTCKKVTLTLKGVLAAFKAVVVQRARQLDKEARAVLKEENKEINKRRKALKAEQAQAIIDFKSGKLCAEEFAEIMARAI